DRQLWSQHQFCPGGSETLIRANDQFAIPAQIAHGGVNLSKTNLHAALQQIMRNTVRSKPAAAISLVVIPNRAVPSRLAVALREGGFSLTHIAKFLLFSAL